ncbi:hypothetical protein EDEG_02820 [Edhazardia aedis USNM 41457]|uniref:Uncharacterized protein n=1 Tax=Edhazardia aedis (strain USNM 41457) TaxID=1003232 RepID=J9DJI8_EDHAE|nr:hypothetical protein EDEG_02820 [Edhazardia aedis USNM 41457]|eukprot:EJW02780.1 hypothetical protein EDEG_02820 [Edhazardia aedis USNM 41457]
MKFGVRFLMIFFVIMITLMSYNALFYRNFQRKTLQNSHNYKLKNLGTYKSEVSRLKKNADNIIVKNRNENMQNPTDIIQKPNKTLLSNISFLGLSKKRAKRNIMKKLIFFHPDKFFNLLHDIKKPFKHFGEQKELNISTRNTNKNHIFIINDSYSRLFNCTLTERNDSKVKNGIQNDKKHMDFFEESKNSKNGKNDINFEITNKNIDKSVLKNQTNTDCIDKTTHSLSMNTNKKNDELDIVKNNDHVECKNYTVFNSYSIQKCLKNKEAEIYGKLKSENIVLKAFLQILQPKFKENMSEHDFNEVISYIYMLNNKIERFMVIKSMHSALNSSEIFNFYVQSTIKDKNVEKNLIRDIRILDSLSNEISTALILQSELIESDDIFFEKEKNIQENIEKDIKNYVDFKIPFNLGFYAYNFVLGFTEYIKTFWMFYMEAGKANWDAMSYNAGSIQFQNDIKTIYIGKHNLLLSVKCIYMNPTTIKYVDTIGIIYLSNKLYEYLSKLEYTIDAQKWYKYNRELDKPTLTEKGMVEYSLILSETMKHLIYFNKMSQKHSNPCTKNEFFQFVAKNNKELYFNETKNIALDPSKINIYMISDWLEPNLSNNISKRQITFRIMIGPG